jgi:hypothetical protein
MEDQALDNFLQQMVVGITGIPATLVRPLWQPEPPNLPTYGTDWVALGIVERDLVRGWNYMSHNPANSGTSESVTWENLTLQVSFYGPDAGLYDGLLRDGLFIEQNQAVLLLNGIGLIEWYQSQVVPVLIKERWWRRIDRHVRFMREIDRVYNIENILSVPLVVTGQRPGNSGPQDITNTWTITPPGIS